MGINTESRSGEHVLESLDGQDLTSLSSPKTPPSAAQTRLQTVGLEGLLEGAGLCA